MKSNSCIISIKKNEIILLILIYFFNAERLYELIGGKYKLLKYNISDFIIQINKENISQQIDPSN